jgi:molecular chaperone DnaK
MVREASAHADEDKKRRELVDLRNQADSLAYSLEKTLKDNREKVADDQAREVEEAVAALRKAAEGEDAPALKQEVDRVTALSHKLAESMYKSTTSAGGGTGAPGGPAAGDASKGDDVVDAEYTVKD